MVDHCESKQCLTGRILEYFGDETITCGQCSVCTGSNPGGELPSPPPVVISPEETELIQQIHDENHTALRQPRQLARFLCGLSSPATTRAKLNRHDHFGVLEEVPFQEVLHHTESLL